MSKFNELLSELETLAKAQPAEGDEKIVAAAAEGGGQGEGDEENNGQGTPPADGQGAAPGAGDGEGEGEMMGKSFDVVLPDGSTAKAVDGTVMLKALQDRVETEGATMAKSMEAALSLLKSQAQRIETLTKAVANLAGTGRGRKAVVSVADKPATTLAKSEPASGLSPEQFMAKALDAQKAGRLSGLEVATAEASLNRGQPVPADIIAKALG